MNEDERENEFSGARSVLVIWICEGKKGLWFVVFADFCGVNTPTMADLKISMI